jgi:hypothetical protein
MKHLIEFRKNATVTVETGDSSITCRIEDGLQCPATVQCYVIYRHDRYTEVADVELEEGLVRGLPCSHFRFIDLPEQVPAAVGSTAQYHESYHGPRRPHFDRIQKAISNFWDLLKR